MRPTLLLATFAAALAITGSATAAGNPFGVTVVRFAPGSTPAQMRAAVTASGGVVVGDLSAIDALAVVPSSAGFDGRVSSKRSVTGLFADTLIGADRHDGMRAGGHGGDPGDGSSSRPGRPMARALPVGRRPDERPVRVAPHDRRPLDRRRGDRHRAWTRTTASCTAWSTSTLGGNFIPCDDLKALFGLGYIDRSGLRDCRDGDFEGHGTWVASRIAGALNGFASNGVAPGVRIGSYKVLAAGLGGLSTWILSGLVAACSDPRIDVVNMSIEGYVDPSDPASVAGLSALHRRRRTTASRAASRSSRPRATPTSA